VDFQGWLLEPYVSGKHATLWFKTIDGDTVRVQERHHPRFIAEPKGGYTVGDIGYLFDEHPDVHATKVVDRFTTLSRRERKKFVEVSVHSASFLDSILEYAERLPEVEEVYDTGLIPVQWYLIHKDVAPSNLCTVEERDGRLKSMEVVDDEGSIEPPPFEALLFEASDSPLEKINVYDESQRLISSLRGKEEAVLEGFQELIAERDPDVIVTDCPVTTIKRVVHRAACNAMDFRFGRDGELYHGRIFLGLTAFLDPGIPGLVERSRFTFAPMGVSANWEPGKTIDSRQCYAAAKMGVVVPKMKGGFGYSTTAWDAVRRDRGGMLFSRASPAPSWSGGSGSSTRGTHTSPGAPSGGGASAARAPSSSCSSSSTVTAGATRTGSRTSGSSRRSTVRPGSRWSRPSTSASRTDSRWSTGTPTACS
jgi:hypothetical protein